ncbi:MAG: patatin-like phospholipase family protein [Candidatus Aminicenantes bacterium]|nr:patatin-like phospholipase family protein [Candidatus Aminicenantes bacterium]
MTAEPFQIRKRWALVLMGGGARGLAHVGVLRVLEKNGLIPDIIAGTSMGAIVGGLFAAGLSGAKLMEMLGGLSLDKYVDKPAGRRIFKRPKHFFEYVILSDYKNRFFSKMGRGKEDAIETYLKSCVGDVRIEDLPIKFICNAVDLVSGKEVLFTEGSLAKALRATMSLPLVFAPVRMRGMLLLDGGVLNSAPVEAAARAGAEVTVLVDIHRPLKKLAAGKIKNTFQVVQRMIDVAWAASFEERASHADFVLRVPVDLGTLDFSEPRRIALRGERVAAANLQRLNEAIGGLS